MCLRGFSPEKASDARGTSAAGSYPGARLRHCQRHLGGATGTGQSTGGPGGTAGVLHVVVLDTVIKIPAKQVCECPDGTKGSSQLPTPQESLQHLSLVTQWFKSRVQAIPCPGDAYDTWCS